MSSFDLKNVIKLIKSSNLDITEGFMMAIKSMKLRHTEASKIYDMLHAELRDKSNVLAMLLPMMLNSKEARGIIEEVIGDDDMEMNKVFSESECCFEYNCNSSCI